MSEPMTSPDFTLPDGTRCPGPPETCVLNTRFVAAALCPHCRDLRSELPKSQDVEEVDWTEWARRGD